MQHNNEVTFNTLSSGKPTIMQLSKQPNYCLFGENLILWKEVGVHQKRDHQQHGISHARRTSYSISIKHCPHSPMEDVHKSIRL